jgi:ABC-type glycerol-3-phosphate transport system permease component
MSKFGKQVIEGPWKWIWDVYTFNFVMLFQTGRVLVEHLQKNDRLSFGYFMIIGIVSVLLTSLLGYLVRSKPFKFRLFLSLLLTVMMLLTCVFLSHSFKFEL